MFCFCCSYLKEFGFTIPDRATVVDDIRVRGCGKSGINSMHKSKKGHKQAKPVMVVKNIHKHNSSHPCISHQRCSVVFLCRWPSVSLKMGTWTPVCFCGRNSHVAEASKDRPSSSTKTGKPFSRDGLVALHWGVSWSEVFEPKTRVCSGAWKPWQCFNFN